MTDSIEMSLGRRLRYTPIRDVIRGRISGRLDWRGRLAAVKMPAEARELISRVVKRTRLWRLEKPAVANELIAHFLDGIESGTVVERIISTFGDERQSAKLIRRAMIRKRPLVWHVWRWICRGVVALIALYALMAIPFFFSHPSPSVDYIAQLNQPQVGVSESDRAWPIYQKALLALEDQPPVNGQTMKGFPQWVGGTPADQDSAVAEAWLQKHSADVEEIRHGSEKSALGFVLGPEGSVNDDALWPGMGAREKEGWGKNPVLISVLLPELNHVRALAIILGADARFAQREHDTERLDRDIRAMIGLADQVRRNDGVLVTGLVALGIDSFALNTLDRVLVSDPGALSEQQLIDFAHQLSRSQTAADLLSIDAERMCFNDVVQRVYSDNGHGDGRLTASGLKMVVSFLPQIDGSSQKHSSLLAYAVGPALVFASASRQEMLVKYNQLMDAQEAMLHLPIRSVNVAAIEDLERSFDGSFAAALKYGVLSALTPSYYHADATAERYLGRRDGVVTAIALELYHRQHGDYPKSLDELTPMLLPAVPADRITGDPIKYRLVDGHPLLYSVGDDRQDDGGVPPMKDDGPDYSSAARWPLPGQPVTRGDWVLYPQTPGGN
jgi:hypothetical protein